MRLTVLGKSPAWQDAGGACSGYLVEEGETALLLDCGNGVFAKLRERRDYAALDAVVISHLHADHILDLVPYAYALTISPRRRSSEPGSPPRLIAPRGAAESLARLTGTWGSETLIADAFGIEAYEAGGEVAIGAVRARFTPVPHHVPAHAVSLAAPSGATLTFGSDCGPSEALVEAARGADLLLIEATLERPEASGPRGHLTPAEAGDHARRAGARRVVLTHVSDELDLDRVASEASEAFGGPVEVALEGAVYDLGEGTRPGPVPPGGTG